MELEELISAALIEVDCIEDVELGTLQPLLDKYNFAIVRGLISPDTILAAKKKLRQRFSMHDDHAAKGEHPDSLKGNFQKLSIGGAEHSGRYRPRCMRTFYNPIWAEDVYGLRDSFRKAARLRNLIYGHELDFAVDGVDDGFWTAARIHHYPAGGGFLVAHKDDVVPVVQAAEGLNGYYQPIIVMSTSGDSDDDDFAGGGGFFEYQGKRYLFERACQLGDVVVYSGATIHGVEDVDLHKPFRQDTLDGRICGFVTIYRQFSERDELQNYLNVDSE